MSESVDWNRNILHVSVHPWRSIHHKNILCEINAFLFRSQRLNSKMPRGFCKILCSIALLILRKLLGIYMKRQSNYMKSKFESQGISRSIWMIRSTYILIPVQWFIHQVIFLNIENRKERQERQKGSTEELGSRVNESWQSTMSSIRWISRLNEPSCKRSFVKTNFQVSTTNFDCGEMNIVVFCSLFFIYIKSIEEQKTPIFISPQSKLVVETWKLVLTNDLLHDGSFNLEIHLIELIVLCQLSLALDPSSSVDPFCLSCLSFLFSILKIYLIYVIFYN